MGLVTRRFLRDQLEPFATAFGRRPGGANRGGASFFHYFGLWCAIKLLRPLHIIESGCHNGVGSWFLRQAAGPYVNITFISPQWPRVFVDRQPGTRRLFGSAFRDFGDVPWEVWLPAQARKRRSQIWRQLWACWVSGRTSNSARCHDRDR